ncbi:MAG TPA: N(4)-(beta-N-acetylglucosaminyl)-L-asparaginase [Flavobacteriales bacterium]|nr:N(4)-(beta-N-acetylglucosaminyl)-L-asparaginase [Flavobacteriales bacterium]HOP43558.1 N(4)-(beta-N-acetylglucosaminyl)-L-asparaginase [Flavobacteriales bacterium]HRW90326.1 N(4)-(beta-N-acetylglucosaminyl)-L-asparaginase [Flavobacteriales bacterium]
MGRTRREFLKTGSAAALGTVLAGPAAARGILSRPAGAKVISTWQHGLQANEAAWNTLGNGGSILDAVELGVAAVESDLTNRSVGLGGRPDRDGHVTLDACIQDHAGRAGAVAFVEHFEHPISIARAVMERTPHVMLVGEGAERWALENGFTRKEVDLPEVRKAWQEWLKTSDYKPVVNVENHDTIGMVGVDASGRLAGSCTTSGMAYKVHGRVGDSPIIGAGLFVDGEVGAACATGTGELVIRIAGSHTVVELMRQGMEPDAACREAVHRIMKQNPGLKDHQVGFLALRADGAHGAHAIYEGFDFALTTDSGTELVKATFEQKWE